MWGFIKRLFSTPDSVRQTVSMVGEGIDAVIYTDEEKARARQKLIDSTIRYMEATSGQNLARRLIALQVTALWVLLVVLAVALNLAGLAERSDYVFGVLDDVVANPFMLVLGFYFATHLARGVKGRG